MERVGPSPPGVVMATISFYPEISGTGQVLTELAVSLAQRGMRVKVYTSQPHYYVRHQRLPGREVYQGVEIVRIPSTMFDKNRRLGRIFNWASFAASAFFALLLESSRDPLFIVSSPPVLPFVGWLLRFFKSNRFLFLVHDVYPDIGVKLGFFRKNGPTVRIWNTLNRLAFGSASKVIVLAEDMAEIVKARMGKGARNGKVEVIHNWADEAFIRPVAREENEFLRRHLSRPYSFLVQYSGNLGFNHDLESLVEAAREVQSLDLGFLFIGEGGKKKKLQEMSEGYGLANVHFFPFQPREMLPHVLSASNLSVVALEQGLEGLAVPSKFYSILASGRPILAIMGENCQMAALIRQYDCGFVVRPGDKESIIRILREAYANPERIRQMGWNARRCFEENFTRSQAIRQYFSLLIER